MNRFIRTQGNVSKVAICQKCNGFTLACHVDSLQKETEKEFTELTNEGFIVKLEKLEETRRRNYSSYTDCVNGNC